MRRKVLVTLSVVALGGAALLGVAAPAFAGAGQDGASLYVDSNTVVTGQLLHVWGACGGGGEGLNFVGSAAFVHRGQDDPYPGDGGSARITAYNRGAFEGEAVVANVPPGDYTVSARCGGGLAATEPITVVRSPRR
ncbi:hypothetical protein [Gandjariella thermophila]|uniref:Carboxypeptidase regulatory-like domain-containing protein n=1 Tax=Gandjariella thermophila TaxID=1931992 RepID=A0A4D4J5N6_9PSEU|nr:hypothetical protein [Gandjariella thermophila]GDY29297.1 hypothetical protein GTS_09300 [Gandjariella thermophila]